MILFTEIILNLLKLAAGLSAWIRWTVSPGIIFQGLAAGRLQPAEAAASPGLTAALQQASCCSAADPHQTRDRGDKRSGVTRSALSLVLPDTWSREASAKTPTWDRRERWRGSEIEKNEKWLFFWNYVWTNLWGSGELEEVHGVLLVILDVTQRLLGLGLSCGLLLGLRLLLILLLL